MGMASMFGCILTRNFRDGAVPNVLVGPVCRLRGPRFAPDARLPRGVDALVSYFEIPATRRTRQRGRKARQTDTKDRENQRPAGRPKQENVYNNENDVNSLERPSGNSPEYAIRRLRKDRSDIHARVLAGEMSPHALMSQTWLAVPNNPHQRAHKPIVNTSVLRKWPRYTVSHTVN
jgi:hypothetical protein